MPSRALVRAFLVLYVTLGVVIMIQSVQTVLAAQRGAIAPPDRLHAAILGALKTAAAILFLIPRTMRLGAVVLLTIFALAFALHAARGNFVLTLMVYAAGVLFVRIHGVRGYRWGAVAA